MLGSSTRVQVQKGVFPVLLHLHEHGEHKRVDGYDSSYVCLFTDTPLLGRLILTVLLKVTFLHVFRFFVCHRLDVLGDDGLPTVFPLGTVSDRVVQAFFAGYSKDVDVLQFLRQGDDVVVKELELTLVPEFRRVGFASTLSVRDVHLSKKLSIKALVNVPVLHAMTDIRGLHNVLHHHRCTSVVRIGAAG